MNLDEIKWYFSEDIKKIVSTSLSIVRFMPVIKNSYSKSDTALNPLMIIEELYFLHKFIVKVLKGIIIIFFFV